MKKYIALYFLCCWNMLIAQNLNHPQTDRHIAYIFAVDTFIDHHVWKHLNSHPIKEGKRLKSVLEKDYGFDLVVLVENPTLADFQKHFKDLINSAQQGDNVVVSISTHGGKNFLVPKDAKYSSQNLLDCSYLYDSVFCQISCLHLLVIVDACEGGCFDYLERKVTSLADNKNSMALQYQMMQEGASYSIMTATKTGLTPAESVHFNTLCEQLEKNEDDVLTSETLAGSTYKLMETRGQFADKPKPAHKKFNVNFCKEQSEIGDFLFLRGREKKLPAPNNDQEKRYDFIESFYENLAQVKKNGKYGFVDKNENLVIPLHYDNVGNFSEGVAWVKQDGLYGFINTSGEDIIPRIYKGAGDFGSGLAPVLHGVQYGFIDKSGRMIISPHYNSAISFSEGLAGVHENGQWSFIDKNGATVISSPQWKRVKMFSCGLAAVQKENGKWGFIDKNGNEVIAAEYDIAFPFENDLAHVGKSKKGEESFYIDKKGKKVDK